MGRGIRASHEKVGDERQGQALAKTVASARQLGLEFAYRSAGRPGTGNRKLVVE
jgi:hypothetical protein